MDADDSKKVAVWVSQHLIFVLLAVFLIIPVVTFLIGSAAILAYIFWPINYSDMTMPSINRDTENIVVLAHGLNDDPSSWSNALKESFELRPTRDQVIALDWNPYSRNTLRCSVDGKRIGTALGHRMAESSQLRSAHLIGHSCGAFVILGFCEALKTARGDIQVQSTYLAPVSIYGGIFWNYGTTHFGSCADFSDAYIDHEDTIGASKHAPHNSHAFDVTAARKSSGNSLSPHLWPPVYYLKLVVSNKYPSLRKNVFLPAPFPLEVLENVIDTPSTGTRPENNASAYPRETQ